MSPMDTKSPLDPTAYADVIIRSSDNVDIRSLLCYVSLPLRDMFQLNHGPAAEQNATKDILPIVDFTEDSETIGMLLNLVYLYTKNPVPKIATCFGRFARRRRSTAWTLSNVNFESRHKRGR
ncbi:hypothetical protein AMATHDRAFT_4145 [Amanita thiersii Skay4041]|uniref:BTB domain-containing protein n=1 Tax=Amanita thiersii Skay4041 TaxID=703135 RepID=A0A2A9NR55_9AGAR|nr:hypothetical protein AMATHDRAFT_4145 [Amanita thiersii Skay4041]